jgi:hypothetical protein
LSVFEDVPRTADPIEVSTRNHERLVGLQASVHPDGDATSFAIHFTNGPPFKVLCPLNEMPGIFSEIRYASTLMLNRQQLHLDRGASTLLELCEGALRPANVEPMIDPLTWDRLFLLQFHDHAPIVIRMSAVETHGALMRLAKVSANLAN